MTRLALQGKHVVRLKSGDPMIFGRAGEEIEHLERAGVPVDIVPGITAGIALASVLGVSLAHRDMAQSVRFVTGCATTGRLPADLDWRGLADPTRQRSSTWLGRLADGQHDNLVLYTGEGLARLLAFARRGGIEADVIAGLRRTRKIVRGPKPAKVLRSIGLSPDVTAEEPTTTGLISTLSALALNGSCVGVQLYPGGEDLLTEFLKEAGAKSDSILFYHYASDEEDERVAHLIDELVTGDINLVAFTSTAQVCRLQEVARRFGRTLELDAAMRRALIAAVGPVTVQAVEEAGWPVAAMPQDSFHLKPMVAALTKRLAGDVSPIPLGSQNGCGQAETPLIQLSKFSEQALSAARPWTRRSACAVIRVQDSRRAGELVFPRAH